MIKLWDATNLPLEDFERLAYATDDNIVVSIKMVRAITTRALAAEREHNKAMQELEDKLTQYEVRFAAVEEDEG